MNNVEFGSQGEQIARQELESKGYTILEMNWRFRHKEIDIIARKNKELVIVEVKTRRSNYFGEPYMAVDRRKQREIIAATNAYIEKYDIDLEVRYDIISIVINDKNQNKITHLEDAFYPEVNW